jgi:hypothetical protein
MLIATPRYCLRAVRTGNPVFWVTHVSFGLGHTIFEPLCLSFGHRYHIGMVCMRDLRQYASWQVWNFL